MREAAFVLQFCFDAAATLDGTAQVRVHSIAKHQEIRRGMNRATPVFVQHLEAPRCIGDVVKRTERGAKALMPEEWEREET